MTPRPFRLRGRPAPDYHIVGDSTAATIHQRNSLDGLYSPGAGSTGSGRGYTTEAPSGTITLTPPDANVVIAFVSLWDSATFYEPGTKDYSGYSDAHAYYVALGKTPIWVAMASSPGYITDPTDLATYNAAIATELGVTLVDASIRVAEYSDTIHYTVQGAQDVVDRLALTYAISVSRLRGTNARAVRGRGPQTVGRDATHIYNEATETLTFAIADTHTYNEATETLEYAIADTHTYNEATEPVAFTAAVDA
jgi:hypothetical protein